MLEEAVIVCEAIDQMIRKAEERTTMQSIKNLMANLHWTAEQAAAAWGIPPEDTKKLLKML